MLWVEVWGLEGSGLSLMLVDAWGLGFGVLGFGFWVLGFGFWVLGLGFRVRGCCSQTS